MAVRNARDWRIGIILLPLSSPFERKKNKKIKKEAFIDTVCVCVCVCVLNMAMALSRTHQVRDATYLDKTFSNLLLLLRLLRLFWFSWCFLLHLRPHAHNLFSILNPLASGNIIIIIIIIIFTILLALPPPFQTFNTFHFFSLSFYWKNNLVGLAIQLSPTQRNAMTSAMLTALLS